MRLSPAKLSSGNGLMYLWTTVQTYNDGKWLLKSGYKLQVNRTMHENGRNSEAHESTLSHPPKFWGAQKLLVSHVFIQVTTVMMRNLPNKYTQQMLCLGWETLVVGQIIGLTNPEKWVHLGSTLGIPRFTMGHISILTSDLPARSPKICRATGFSWALKDSSRKQKQANQHQHSLEMQRFHFLWSLSAISMLGNMTPQFSGLRLGELRDAGFHMQAPITLCDFF